MSALRRKTYDGIVWSVGRAILQLVIGVVVGVTLARLLPPSDFGWMAIAMGFGYLAEALALHGIAAAVVRQRILRRLDVETALTLCVLLALLMAGLFVGASSWLADWYDAPVLMGVLQMMAAVQSVALVGTVPRALMRRHLRFRELAWLDLGSYLFGYAGVSVFLAWQGYGVWSLAGGLLSWQSVAAVWAWVVAGGRHWRLHWSLASARSLLPFAFGVTGKSLVIYGNGAIDSVWLGKLVSATALGLYHRAHQLALLPLQRVGAVIAQVMFPVYALLQ